MPREPLSTLASTYAWAVVSAGLFAGAGMIAVGDPQGWNWIAIAVFGSVGVLVTSVAVSCQGFLPTSISFETGSAFAYALFFLEHPGAMVLVLWAETLADWLFKRRKLLSAAFNLGQLGLATLAAWGVRHWLAPDFTVLDRFDGVALAAVFLSAGTFFVVNHA